MVKQAWDYEWSSARFHVGESVSDMLVTDRTLLGLVTNWKELLTGDDDEANKVLRAGVKTGRPLGNKSFLQRIEAITGRELGYCVPGIPRGNTYYAMYYIGNRKHRKSLDTDDPKVAKARLRKLEECLDQGSDTPFPDRHSCSTGSLHSAYVCEPDSEFDPYRRRV